jgi:molybdopterin-binding protein
MPELSLAEGVVLALATTGASHGWAIAQLLDPDGEVGNVWTLSKPLTYRAVDGLVTKGLLRRKGTGKGSGRDRVMLATTAAGRRASSEWLDAPIEHLRDVRTELLVKLVLRERAGLDRAPFLIAQLDALAPIIDSLVAGRSPGGSDIVADWRAENAASVRRFLHRAIGVDGSGDERRHTELQLSARNQLRGTIQRVQRGEVLSSVRVNVDPGQCVTAIITSDAIDDLDLVTGDEALVVIKSTEVMIASVPRIIGR